MLWQSQQALVDLLPRTPKLFDALAEIRAWDATPDGQRFLLNLPVAGAPAPPLRVLVIWYSETLNGTEESRR